MIIIRNKLLRDYIKGYFYKIRFWTYRKIARNKLKNSSPEIKDGWNLTFSDYFTEKTWSPSGNTTKWKIGEGWGLFHPDKLSVYYGPPELLPHNGAKFTVKYKPKTFDYPIGEETTIPFEVSLITSQKSFKQQYGRFECRMTIPHEKYVWPAFWMWGSTWPPEIDVHELYGGKDGKKAGRQEMGLHYGSNAQGNRDSSKAWKVMIESHKDPREFHEFVCEWSPEKIVFITDGVKIFEYARPDILEKWLNDPVAQMWVVVNHSLQDRYKDEFTEDYYSEFIVDYVRVYENI